MTPALFDNTAETAVRWGVYRRTRGGRWTLIATAGTEDAAHRLLMRLMDDPKHRGHSDWCVQRLATDGNPGTF